MGLAEFAKYKTDGTAIRPFKMPFNMWFVPNPALAELWPNERQFVDGREIPFYEQLTQIPDGSNLFEVWAQDVPDDLRSFRFPQGINSLSSAVRVA